MMSIHLLSLNTQNAQRLDLFAWWLALSWFSNALKIIALSFTQHQNKKQRSNETKTITTCKMALKLDQ